MRSTFSVYSTNWMKRSYKDQLILVLDVLCEETAQYTRILTAESGSAVPV